MLKKINIKYILTNEYSFTLINKITTILLGVFTSAFINRYAGASLKGEYAVLLNLLNIFSVFANLGLYQAYPYYKRKGYKDILSKFINVFYYQFIFYCVMAFCSYLLIDNKVLNIVLLMLPIAVLTNQLNFIIMVENVNYKNKINIFGSFIKFLLAFVTYFFFSKRIEILVLNLMIYDIFLLFCYLRMLRVKFTIRYLNLNFIISIIKFGFVAMVTSLLVNLNYKLDVLMLNSYLSSSLVGIYSVGVTLAEFGWLIPDTFKDVLFSKTAKSDSINSIINCLKISFYVIIVITFMVILFGKIFIKIMYGNEFLDSYIVTVILFLGIPSMTWFKIISTLYLAKGKRYFYLMALLLSVVSNVIFNIALIPKFSIYGAAIASVFSYTVCGGIFLIDFCKKYNLKMINIFSIKNSDFKGLIKKLKSQ